MSYRWKTEPDRPIGAEGFFILVGKTEIEPGEAIEIFVRKLLGRNPSRKQERMVAALRTAADYVGRSQNDPI